MWQSGKPFDIVNGGGNQPYSNRATPVDNGGPDRPNQIADGRPGHKMLSTYFNTAAFVPQALGTIGDTQLYALYGTHFRHIDLSVLKDFAETERVHLQFRAESYNFTNTPSRQILDGSGNVQVGSPSFGPVQNTELNYAPRLYQFALQTRF